MQTCKTNFLFNKQFSVNDKLWSGRTALMKVKFSEHQADHFKEQAPVCGSTQSGVCLWAENQIL